MALLLQLSDFTYVNRAKIHLGKMLRFTLGVQIELPFQQVGEFAIEGCVALFDKFNQLYWSPPMTQYSSTRRRQLFWVNPVLHNLVKDALEEHPELIKPMAPPIKHVLDTMTVEGKMMKEWADKNVFDVPKYIEKKMDEEKV